MSTPMDGSAGTCSGSVGGAPLSGQVFLNVNGIRVSTAGGAAGGVFSLSECECSTSDIFLEFILQQAIPNALGDLGAAMYIGIGTDCTDPTTRSTSCKEITRADYPDGSEFNLSFSLFKTQGRAFYIPLPAAVVTSPKIGVNPPPFTCQGVTSSRSLTIFLGDIAASPATCKIPLPVRTLLPPPPTGVTTRPGNRAVSVLWSVPQVNEGVERYQILCRDRARPDVPLKPELQARQLFYSTCIDPAARRHIRRTNIPGTGATLPIPDMARSTLSSAAPSQREPLETMDMGSADLSAATDPPGSGDAFRRLDPRFLCSGEVRAASGATLEYRVDGLDNGRQYEFVVVAIDSYGNATPSQPVLASPQQTQNLLEALHRSGNYAGGFGCSATGGTEGHLPGALAALLWFAWTRRRRGPAS
ncbi:MAG: hypothetical protein RMK29_09590 [Myxococcales bacterium]|nr:fibronectin type III domain-containing protein [Myxococcota bacterium]MDW8281953.1 hypothetical protein [Myxococcales bacterium]